MYKIPYTYTNKSKIVFYLMILAYFLLRLILMIQIKAYKLEGYEVFLLPTIIYYLTIFIVLTAIFFGYKFFFTTYDENTITYHNILLSWMKLSMLSSVKMACTFIKQIIPHPPTSRTLPSHFSGLVLSMPFQLIISSKDLSTEIPYV